MGIFGGQLQILGLMTLAMLLGAAVGYERELKNKPAGLRTHMIVSGAAALLVALGDVVIDRYAVEVGAQLVRSDPVRIIEAVITGVSFLGAGTILRNQGESTVEGLTTAASILFAVAVGVCIALSQLALGIGATVLVLLTLRGIKSVEQWFK